MQILEAQTTNFRKYELTIARRSTLGNWLRFTEEIGELAKAIRRGDKANMDEEAADALAWLLTVCSAHSIDLQSAYIAKYGGETCFRCKNVRCECPEIGIPAKA